MPAIKDILIQGGKQQKVLEMTYKKKDGSVVKRKVEPYEIRGDVFWGWDTNDEHIKRFVIWRIRDAKVTKDSFDPRFDIKMSKAGGVTSKSMTSSLEITLNGLKGALNESSKDLDEVHSIRRELTSLQQMLAEAGKGDFVLGKDSGEWYEYAHEQYGVKDAKDVNQTIMGIAKETVGDFKRNIKLWKDIRIGFAENLGGALGRFLSGSASSTPVIMLSEKSILSGMKKYNVTTDDAVSPTVIHELGHAMCELDRDFFNDEYIQVPNKRDEEKWVEEFAREYYDYSHIPEGVKKLVKAMKKMNEDIDLNKLPDDVYELPDTAGITKVGEALTKQIHGSVYRMRRIEHKRFGTVYAVWYRTYLPAYYSPKDGFIHSGGDSPLTGEVKKKTEWLVALYNKIYKDGVRAGSE